MHKRGEKCDDVLQRRRFTIAELWDVTLPVGNVTCLAILFFLSKHAEGRAEIIVREVHHGGQHEEGDDRGSG